MSIAVALADDSLIMREGVARIVAAQPATRVVASCGDLPSLLAAVDTERPDVVVTDIRMPPTGTDEGIRLSGILRGRTPRSESWFEATTRSPAMSLPCWNPARTAAPIC
jgi:DNA-binding NarL/FixJ family response regulator